MHRDMDRCHLTSAQSCGSRRSASPASLSVWGRTGTWSCSPLGASRGHSHRFQLERKEGTSAADTAEGRLMFDGATTHGDLGKSNWCWSRDDEQKAAAIMQNRILISNVLFN